MAVGRDPCVGLSLETMAQMLDEAEIPEDFDVVLSPGRPLDPIGDREGTKQSLRQVLGAGVAVVSVTVTVESAERYSEQLEALNKLEREL